jgi:hypothetical protein
MAKKSKHKDTEDTGTQTTQAQSTDAQGTDAAIRLREMMDKQNR